jgi:4-amino-4-deoxy-L-arabinose transferase-like glycosyltransferase
VRGVSLGVALVAIGLYFVGLGTAPFLDPPEGFHAEVAREMARGRDWVVPRINGVRYFETPPLLYWLMAGSFEAAGVSPLSARFWTALAAVGCAAVTARLGVLLGGARLGLLAGLMVAANLGLFVYGRLVSPEVPFMFAVTLAWAGFALAYLGDRRRGLVIFYAGLGGAILTKGLLGALGPVLVVAVFFWLTRERPLGPWVPWWGVLLTGVIGLPWYLIVETRSPGFLWHSLIDSTLYGLTRQRTLPEENIPLGSLEFLVVTLLAFLPWSLALPRALARALQRRWESPTARLWLVFGLWSVAVLGFWTLVPFKLPHYALPAFPAFALLVARTWDEAIDRVPGALSARALLVPALVLFALVTAGFGAAAAGVLPIPDQALSSFDVATRNLTARGQRAPGLPLEAWSPLFYSGAAIFALATVALAVAAWRRAVALGVGVALAATIAFLPAIAANGMTQFARTRSAGPLATALLQRLRPGDLVVHEGAIATSASILLIVGQPVRVVNGLYANLALGAALPEARDTFWDSPRLEEAWSAPGRHFLISAVDPARSVVRALPPPAVHLIAQAGGRRLYSNLGDPGSPGR